MKIQLLSVPRRLQFDGECRNTKNRSRVAGFFMGGIQQTAVRKNFATIARVANSINANAAPMPNGNSIANHGRGRASHFLRSFFAGKTSTYRKTGTQHLRSNALHTGQSDLQRTSDLSVGRSDIEQQILVGIVTTSAHPSPFPIQNRICSKKRSSV